MKIKLIGHASVIIEIGGKKILTDPWFNGKVFNDSWTLHPKFSSNLDEIEKVDYLWISHEHPDHLHFPTLKSFSEKFRSKVTLLFQNKHTDRVPSVLRKIGFSNIKLLKHRKIYSLTDELSVYNYQVGHLDSSLAIFSNEHSVLNLNDCTASPNDLRKIKSDVGKIDVLLHQFSIAHYPGFKDYMPVLKRMASRKLQDYKTASESLSARFTIPFASFVYFSCEDNKFINKFANTPRDAVNAIGDTKSIVLYPGYEWKYGDNHDNNQVLKKYEEDFKIIPNLEYDSPNSVSLDSIRKVYNKFADDISNKYYNLILSILKPMIVKIYDLDKVIVYDIKNKKIKICKSEVKPEIEMHSQSLKFAFENDWGFSTLTVGGRIRILRNNQKWIRHRIFYTVRHSEIYLKLKYIFTTQTIHHIMERFGGSFDQLIYKLKRVNP